MQDRYDFYRREMTEFRQMIVRRMGTPEKSQAFVQELLETNWQEVIEQIGIQCSRCGKYALPNNSGDYKLKEWWCSDCWDDIKKGIQAVCERCKMTFVAYWFFDTVCPTCLKVRRRESVKVSTHLGRARSNGLPATLTLDQWYDTLDNFQWKCAYCLERSYTIFEHFIPVCKGGGTTQDNCIPSCQICSGLKHQLHPDKVTAIPREDIARVQRYLNQFVAPSKNSS